MIYLKRLSMNRLMLDEKLEPGEIKELSEAELELLSYVSDGKDDIIDRK